MRRRITARPRLHAGDIFVDDVEALLQLDLRNAVMSSIMCQDREYFDHHQAGVLQERSVPVGFHLLMPHTAHHIKRGIRVIAVIDRAG